MGNEKYIKAGRLVRIMRGPRENRLGVIVDIIDANRIIVENPQDEKMWRHVQNLKNIEPLKFKVNVTRGVRSRDLAKALETSNIIDKFGATRKARRIVGASALSNATDFERYQLRVAKRSMAHWTRKVFAENDNKCPVSWRQKMIRKLEKSAANYARKSESRTPKKRVATKRAVESKAAEA